MTPFTLLDSISRSELILDPYPHFIIRDALPSEIYKELADNYPTTAISNDSPYVLNDRSHTRRIYSRNFSKLPQISSLWKDFAHAHTCPEFFHTVVQFFLSSAIEKFYPGLSRRLLALPVVNRTGSISHDSGACLTDFQIVANLPVSDYHSSRTPHLDNPQQLYAFLYYMRSSDDESIGGGLNLYKPLPPALSVPHARGRSLDSSLLEHRYTLNYEPNTAILFLNTRGSYHSVQPIFSQTVLRRSVNIIGELPPGSRLFKLND